MPKLEMSAESQSPEWRGHCRGCDATREESPAGTVAEGAGGEREREHNRKLICLSVVED